MSPILYYHAVSVPSRAALLAVRNLGIDVEVKVVDIYKGEQNTAEYLSINPLHQVPVFADKNFVITESRAIICYLASAANKFYPTDLKTRALVDSRLFFDATNSFPAIRDFAVSGSFFRTDKTKTILSFRDLYCELVLKRSIKNAVMVS